ncbi:MAG: hypothetical protein AAGF90_01880 [Pseudomonadota bacterium]
MTHGGDDHFDFGREGDGETAGLLLPAVQQVREAGRPAREDDGLDLRIPEEDETAGLLLPAVQKAADVAPEQEIDFLTFRAEAEPQDEFIF